MNVQSTTVFISSKTADGLQDEMMSIQARLNLFFAFRDIQHASGRWFAWFDIPLTRLREFNALK